MHGFARVNDWFHCPRVYCAGRAARMVSSMSATAASRREARAGVAERLELVLAELFAQDVDAGPMRARAQ